MSVLSGRELVSHTLKGVVGHIRTNPRSPCQRPTKNPSLAGLISFVESLCAVMGVRSPLSTDSTFTAFAQAIGYTRASSNGALAAGVFVSAAAGTASMANRRKVVRMDSKHRDFRWWSCFKWSIHVPFSSLAEVRSVARPWPLSPLNCSAFILLA